MPDVSIDTWAIELNQAIPHLNKQVNDTTVRKRLWLAMMKKRGKIRAGVAGSISEMNPIDWKTAPVEDLDETTNPVYVPRDYLKWSSYDWKGKHVTDAMSYMEFLKLKDSPNTIVDRRLRIMKKQYAALEQWIGKQLYTDSTATGHTRDFDGIETACAALTGEVLTGDIVAVPNGTYQGISCALAQSGSWSADLTTSPNHYINTDWPDGQGDPDYCYRAPILANWSSNAWGTEKTTWESNCQRVISRCATWIRNTMSSESTGKSLFCMLSNDLMAGFKNSLRASNLILTPHKEAETLGFGDVLNFEGAGIQSEPECPVNTGYIVDLDDVELNFITPEMIHAFSVFNQESDLMWKWLAVTAGNLTLDPRRVCKMHNFTGD